MVSSTKTLLSVANEVLLNVNERPKYNLNNTLGNRVKACVSDAVVEVCSLNDWSWSISLIPALSWGDDTATLPDNVQRVLNVYWITPLGNKCRLSYVSPTEFNLIHRVGYSTVLNVGSYARFWTAGDGYNQVRAMPYPTDGVTQASIQFQVVSWVAAPTLDSGLFSMPDEFVSLVTKRATALFCTRHLGDPSLGAHFNTEYEALAQRLRDRMQRIPPSGYNIYRGNR